MKPRLKALRARLGITQQQLADRLGCSICAVRLWEQEIRTPSSLAMRAIEQLDANTQEVPRG